MYKITISDPLTGKVYNPNGTPFRDGKDEAYFEKPFPSLERAKVYCRAVIRRYPDLCCSVFDDNRVEVWKEMDREWLNQKAEEKRLWLKVNERENRRNRLIFLAFMVSFSFIIAALTAFLNEAGLSLWVTIIASGVIAIIMWYVMGRRF
jgi:hypothetical protein